MLFLRRIGPFQALARTPKAFYFLRRFPPSRRSSAAAPPLVCPCSFLWLSFRALKASLKQVKGWRRFTIADARRRWSDYRGREPHARKGETRPEARSLRTGSKDRAIDPMSGRITSAAKSPIRGRTLVFAAAGASPSCLRNISRNPCLRDLTLQFAHEANAAAFRRERRQPHSRDPRATVQQVNWGLRSLSPESPESLAGIPCHRNPTGIPARHGNFKSESVSTQRLRLRSAKTLSPFLEKGMELSADSTQSYHDASSRQERGANGARLFHLFIVVG